MDKLPAAILDAKYIDLIGLASFVRKAVADNGSELTEEKLAKALFDWAAGEVGEG